MGFHWCKVMKFSRLQISIILAIAVLAWFVVLLVQGTKVSWDHLAPFSTVVGVLVILLLVVEHYLWRQSWLQKWFVSMPDLRGTWKVVIQSDWVDSETGETVPPIQCFMGVKQSMSSLQMHLMTPESESWFVAYNVNYAQSGHGYQIAAVYTNKPNVNLRSNRSSMHLGALVLETHGENEVIPKSISGEYWTDRKTTGTIVLTDRDDKLFTRFDDVQKMWLYVKYSG
ncbi:MAG: hypothetical protein A6F70_09705 [Cycloclasticus sp. symbiont of Bathymodiolus heckerae]|nr:MAG: hypothetical protein A6F70_09705 [Cycloclasticus sp. symbiont of Bathymodiolus heckerae]